MAVSMAAFTTNDSITKVVSSEMNFGQVMLVRGVFAILLVAAFAWHQGALRPLRTLMQKPVALRVFGEIGGTISFMAALAHLPLANTSAIFQALPLAITLGAALIFREPVGWRRWSAIVVGFIGVLIIVRPGLAGFSQYSRVRAGVRGLLRAARSRDAKDPGADSVAVHYAADHRDRDAGRWRHPRSARRLDAALDEFARPAGVHLGAAADRLSLHHHGAAHRRHLGGGAVPLFRAAVGDAARLSRVRRRARRDDGAGASIIVLSGLYAFYRERIRHRALAAESSGLPPDGL